MIQELTRTRILITVMTYPHPSTSYQELVCTAGVTEDGQWIRLYPVDYRYRPYNQRFRKYQWIEVDLEPTRQGNDKRKESRKPILESIRILGDPISTKSGWKERRSIVEKLPVRTLNEFKELYEINKTSLGVIKPSKVLDLKIKPQTAAWKPKWQQLFDQFKLFGPSQKPLQKIPYKFSYVFECEDSQKPHNAMIEDWELGMLWLNEVDRLGSEERAAESVRNKFLNDICGEGKDIHFFMGTKFPYNTWLVLGVFYPPKEKGIQGSLF